MNMTEWAKREVEIACKRENPNRKEGEFDYGCACYESALKAFNSLMEDGHSGMSIGFTKNILVKLIEGRPLTPIEDTEDIWKNVTGEMHYDHELYQCERMFSLFKYVYPDGTIRYSDNNHYCAIDVKSGIPYHNGLVSRLIHEMFPITMPYFPDEPIKVYCGELLTDRKNGDFDTKAILYAIKPDGEKIDIHRYFKENENKDGDPWIEIDEKEYNEREQMYIAREQREAEEGKQS